MKKALLLSLYGNIYSNQTFLSAKECSLLIISPIEAFHC